MFKFCGLKVNKECNIFDFSVSRSILMRIKSYFTQRLHSGHLFVDAGPCSAVGSMSDESQKS